MAARGSGAIVTISSAIGTVGERNRSAYCAAKSGVENLTRAMALDHGRDGIRANCVAPGLIDTPLIRGGKVGGGANPAALQAMVDVHHAIPRIGQPEEVAAAIAFLASDDASFITGAILPVDAGWTAA
jgi:meso-butanediol dehydrogenase/(S,S)-butanediol dehydrogenase/diacetyl reductase